MNVSELRAKVVEEIQNIPEDKLTELLNLIHAFRLRLEPASFPRNSIMKFAGCWNDLPDDIYSEFWDDISQRRQQAFSQRQNRETSFG
ncbi:hypothetical protein [Microseira wollei]|uniref:Uncharacterized protein n=1 Tax=Microseira wollei NIES-4236 TaxID=2530354 RepID=A0AAV3XML5_9CYAN|nr:hypothetical protein [Microseira wollei]GET41909.1 hypothetical protein MiSe_67230 [Microseira wollei NIES-4236]